MELKKTKLVALSILPKAKKAFMLFVVYRVAMIRLLWTPFSCLLRCYATVALDASRPLRERDARSVLWCDVTSS